MNPKLRKIFRKRYIGSVLFATFGVIVAGVVFAQTYAQLNSSNRSIEVSPPSQEITADPGKSVQIKAKVTNKSDAAVNLKVRVDDFTAQGEEGQVSLIDKGVNSLSNWVKVEPDTLALQAGETKEVVATANIPGNVAGGQYGSFVFSAAGDSSPNGAAVSQEVASLFLIKVNGDIKENVSLLEFKAPMFSEFGPIPFDLKFQNTGNVHVKPHGVISVTDVFGRKVKDIAFAGQNVLPDATRIVKSQLDNQLLVGPYKATAIIYYGGPNGSSETLVANTGFNVFPLRIAVVIVVGLAVLYFLRKRLFKAFRALAGK